VVYKWKEGAHYAPEKFNPQVIGEHLDGLQAKRGQLTPRLVVEDAKRKTSPTHGIFTWNNDEAAQQYRLAQARQLLRSITVVVSVQKDGRDSDITSRAFVVVTKPEGRVYEPVSVALKDADMRAELLTQATRELGSFRKKYQQLQELAGVFSAIDEVLPLLHGAAEEAHQAVA
jgi:hypothetical protein